MERFASTTVDARDMLCAQALALVARAVGRLPVGGTIVVRYNAEDVKRDLLVWSTTRGHAVREDAAALRITRQRA